jgi:hypothetical protein
VEYQIWNSYLHSDGGLGGGPWNEVSVGPPAEMKEERASEKVQASHKKKKKNLFAHFI